MMILNMRFLPSVYLLSDDKVCSLIMNIKLHRLCLF